MAVLSVAKNIVVSSKERVEALADYNEAAADNRTSVCKASARVLTDRGNSETHA